MHDFAFEWMPDAIRWFIDGRMIHEEFRAQGKQFPETPSKIFITLWIGTGQDSEWWLGKFAYPGHPVVARYERVAFTKMGDLCHFPASIVCKRQQAEKR